MSKRILIVDDSAFARMMLRDVLTKNGYEVVGEAENADVAVRKYRQCKPDLVTMDITMPEINGIEVVKLIIKEDPNAKIIMCSAMGQRALVMEALQAGAKGFVVKPHKKDDILQAIDRALGRP